MPHFILLEGLAVHNRYLHCPHAGNDIKNKGVSPESLVENIPAVFFIQERPWKLCIIITNPIGLPDIIPFYQHDLLPICHQPICHLSTEIPRWEIGELLLSCQMDSQSLFNAGVHTIPDTAHLQAYNGTSTYISKRPTSLKWQATKVNDK